MNNNEWITDRLPEQKDTSEDFKHLVWVFRNGKSILRDYSGVYADAGEPWKPIAPPELYVKPKRYIVKEVDNIGGYDVFHVDGLRVAMCICTLEAAERIAEIYDEVNP